MRIYAASSEETLRALKLLKEWAAEGFVSKEQFQLLKQETVSEFRLTNIFLRLVLFLFSLISIGAAVGLFFVVSPSRSSQPTGVILLIFAAGCYAAAEFAVSRWRLYRYGIEEALAVCSIGFLCVGLQFALFSESYWHRGSESIVPAAGLVFSLWIWHRFGRSYAFLAAMFFAVFLPGYWTSSHTAQHLIVASLYAIGLACVVAIRDQHRFDYLEEGYSFAEACLWLGIYVALNLKLSSPDLSTLLRGEVGMASDFSKPFYWSSWVLIWCLPPIVLARGIRQKDRFVIAVGAITAVLTFVSNKPYLGWARHTWDPMLLGVFLAGAAELIRRWLARGPDGIRHGFTAARLSGKDKRWMNVGSTVVGLTTPEAITPAPKTSGGDFHFGGGTSGGGGASSEF